MPQFVVKKSLRVTLNPFNLHSKNSARQSSFSISAYLNIPQKIKHHAIINDSSRKIHTPMVSSCIILHSRVMKDSGAVHVLDFYEKPPFFENKKIYLKINARLK